MTLLRWMTSQVNRLFHWRFKPQPRRSLMCSCDHYCFCDRCVWDRARSSSLRKAQRAELGDHRPAIVRAIWPSLALLTWMGLLLLTSCTATYPVAATGPLNGTREGRSASVQVLGITVVDGGTVREAARAGGISNVHTVDVRQTVILRPVYVKRSTIVTGE